MPKLKATSSTDGERNWSELPQDILHLFSKQLPDISDFIRFRAVCKSWQLSAPINDPPPQLPWLLEYLVQLLDQIHVLNPLTHDQIHVPFLNLGGVFPDYSGPDPIEGGDIVVISGFKNYMYTANSNNPPNMMAFWRPKADDWVSVEGVGGSANAFYMGQYFSNDIKTGITNVIDIATKKLAYQVAPPEGTNPLLRGCNINNIRNANFYTTFFSVMVKGNLVG